MEQAQHLAALRREANALATAARKGLDVPVPSCPEWRVGDLVVHLGVVHRWVTEMVRTGATERARRAPERFGRAADDPELPEWFEEGAHELVRALDDAGPDREMWTFFGLGPSRFWARRQAHETAVHRWDAQLSHGRAEPIDSELAADGTDEALELLLGVRRLRDAAEGKGESFHFHRTDGDGEWLVRFDTGGPVVERTHGKGGVAVRGPASDLMLFLWHRIPTDELATTQLEVFGDEKLLDRWFELVPPA